MYARIFCHLALYVYIITLWDVHKVCIFKFCNWLSLGSVPMLELGDGSLRATLATSEEDTIQFPFCVENHANTIRKTVHNWYPRANFCKLETVKNT